VRPELELGVPESAGDQDGELVERRGDRGLEADVLPDALHPVRDVGAAQERIEGAGGALAGP
jgi:hypothetical protein